MAGDNLNVRTVVGGLAFPEAPRWRDGALWFSDFFLHEVRKITPDGRWETVAKVPGQPSGLGWTPDGLLLVVSMVDRRLLRQDPTGLAEVADLTDLTGFYANDMVVDAKGRAYVGNTGFNYMARETPRPTGLVLVEPDGGARIVADGLMFPNGAVITPDGATLVVAETYAARLTAFTIAKDGSLSGQRVWAALEGEFPDGICLDAEGAIWVASPSSGQVMRVREGGEIVERHAIVNSPTACVLGGEDGRDLFVTSTDMTGADPAGGRIDALRVSVPGPDWA
jgi:sugar lactone lactonase YvrE